MIILLKTSICAAYDAIQAAFICLQIMAILLGHHFLDKMTIKTETLLTRLLNGNASQYVATFKTTEALLLIVL